MQKKQGRYAYFYTIPAVYMQKSCTFAAENKEKGISYAKAKQEDAAASDTHDSKLAGSGKPGGTAGGDGQGTQATLSRDLKQLRISKVRSRGGRNVYALPREGQFQPVPTHEEIKQSRWSLGENGSLMVIHTPPGHASMVAYDLDALRSPLLLGTIAGDDTILVVLAPEAEPAEVRALIRETVPGLKLKG